VYIKVNMKAIILARVSTEEQKKIGQSIPAQLTKARDYAKRHGLDIINEYQFDESSTKDKRKKFEKAIDEIKKSKVIIALIVETIDRLQRSFKESVVFDELRKTGKVELHFIREGLIINANSNSADILRWDMGVMFAKSYVLQISDNVKRTFEQKLKRGEAIGKAPLGYINDEENTKKIIVVDKIKAPFIIKIFELYATGNYSMERIAKIVNEEGLRSRNGNKLKIRQIETILKNPFYYGQMAVSGQLLPHCYPPLISFELFTKCKLVREGYPKKPSKYSLKPFMFSGLMTCSRCGCRITPELHKKIHVYYHCTNSKGVCEKIYVREEDILTPLRDVLRGINLPQERLNEVVQSLKTTEQGKNEFHHTQLKILRARYDKLEEYKSTAYIDRLEGRITADKYDQLIKEFAEEQEGILSKIAKLDQASKSFYLTANTILSLAQRAEEIFMSSEPDEKRRLLNFLFLNLKLDGKILKYSLKAPFEGVLSATTSHNWGV